MRAKPELLLVLGLLVGCATSTRHYEGKSKLEEMTMESGQTLSATSEECSLTVKGPFTRLQLRGNENYFKLTGPVDRIEIDGRGNTVDCSSLPTQVRLRGASNQVRMPQGQPRPQMDVQGNDQHVQFQTPSP